METKVREGHVLLESELERFVEVAFGEFGAEKVILLGSLARVLDGDEDALGERSDTEGPARP